MTEILSNNQVRKIEPLFVNWQAYKRKSILKDYKVWLFYDDNFRVFLKVLLKILDHEN
jgi:hypothetical protein